jgi:hypothetical protein
MGYVKTIEEAREEKANRGQQVESQRANREQADS